MAAVIRTISYNDDQLVIMINNKNQKAFAQLYDKYAAALYGSIYRQVENKKIAEDILQQTFFKVWASLTDHIVLKKSFIYVDAECCKEYNRRKNCII